jgi:hypothetical protein
MGYVYGKGKSMNTITTMKRSLNPEFFRMSPCRIVNFRFNPALRTIRRIASMLQIWSSGDGALLWPGGRACRQAGKSHRSSVPDMLPQIDTASVGIRSGQFGMNLSGATNSRQEVWTSTNLVDWTKTATLTNTPGTMSYGEAASDRTRFFRVRQTRGHDAGCRMPCGTLGF